MKHLVSLVVGATACTLLAGTAHAASWQQIALRGGHVDYTDGNGTRSISELEYLFRTGKNVAVFTAAHGRRDWSAARAAGLRLDASVHHQWTRRLGTRTAVQWGDDARVFARRGIEQNLAVALGRHSTATAGARRTWYAGGNETTAYYAEGSRTLGRATLRFRHTRYNTTGIGRSHGNLASVRLKDRAGAGSTSVWLGQATSVQQYAWSEQALPGRSASIAVQRSQPLAEGWTLSAGVENTWNRTGSGRRYEARGVRLGIARRW